jgi:hypothetical protein
MVDETITYIFAPSIPRTGDFSENQRMISPLRGIEGALTRFYAYL